MNAVAAAPTERTVSTWDDLVTVALIGTDRRPLPPVVAPDGTVVAAGDLDSDEQRLLAAGAVMAVWRNAGHRPAAAPAVMPETAPIDVRPLCSARATQLLELVIEPGAPFAEAGALVAQWLDAAAAAGCRVPHRLVVPVLTHATAHPAQRPAAAAVVDQRGRWVAAHHPFWEWVESAGRPPDPAEWTTATRARRLTILQDLRRRDPAAGRALLEGDLASSSAAERTELVGGLAFGLSADDEPLLDALLDDRSKGVRAAAAALLDRLPGSRRAQRLQDALAPLVHVERIGRVRKGVHLTVDLPDVPEAGAEDSLARDLPGDGRDERSMLPRAAAELTGRPSVSAVGGRRAARLTRLVAGAPLGWWDEQGISAATLVEHAIDQRELLVGILAATIAQRDEAMAIVLFEHLALPSLVPLLPTERAAAVLQARVVASSDGDLPLALLVAARLPAPWTPALSEAVVARFRVARTPGAVAPQRHLLALHLDLSVLPRIEEWIADLAGEEHAVARRHVGQLHQSLSMRQTIAEELTP